MSLATVSTGDVIRQQVIYKCYAMADLWRSLVVIQLIAIIFSALGSGGMGTSDDMFSLDVTTFSTDTVFLFTVFWLIVTSALITSKSYRFEDFSYVTTRGISQASNGILLLLTVFTATVFTIMSSYVIFMTILVFDKGDFYPGLASVGTPGEVYLSFLAIFGYLLVAAGAGYFFGILIQISKLFIGIIPVILFGPLFVRSYLIYEFGYQFYALETSITLFMIKAIGTALVLYGAGSLILNKKEVREI
ncbi:hypothetical protein [Jeotgalibacillus salarius]|uniref:Uncharacterized protein n=1 Tax=Jeotgalibacillus salarius TaxID=546023 RepID=A0A4Y8LLF5_9BACL|nr:hypothetical protein [Jeotgalibacillus salarius]TFE02067.1 hypothetical protein E2626_05695 [Jeotgalibacillus salarius]